MDNVRGRKKAGIGGVPSPYIGVSIKTVKNQEQWSVKQQGRWDGWKNLNDVTTEQSHHVAG